jgi:hypothetical protein
VSVPSATACQASPRAKNDDSKPNLPDAISPTPTTPLLSSPHPSHSRHLFNSAYLHLLPRRPFAHAHDSRRSSPCGLSPPPCPESCLSALSLLQGLLRVARDALKGRYSHKALAACRWPDQKALMIGRVVVVAAVAAVAAAAGPESGLLCGKSPGGWDPLRQHLQGGVHW